MTPATLTKLSTLPGATVDPLGARGQGPITDGYVAKGTYVQPPTVGVPFVLFRTESNGVKKPGLYTTSAVQEVETEDGQITFRTYNSTYRLTHEEAPKA